MPPDDTFWKSKLAAFLHDPPEKPYDFGKWHKERAEHYANRLGLPSSLFQDKSPDWTAAAADRLIFPDPGAVHGLGQGVGFRHPLTGHPLCLSWPANQDDASVLLDNGFPEYSGDLTDREKFFLLWRCWIPASSSQPKAGALPFLPADTRIPDGSIWSHLSVVSALEGTRNASGSLSPALLLFQIGPVQEFIAQARSTRDLWSGSFLLSWLIAHGLRKIASDLGPDAVVFPSLRGQALFDWLNRETLERAKFRQGEAESGSFWDVLGLGQRKRDALVPNLPNRFLAIVPADYDPSAVRDAILAEWTVIGDACLALLKELGAPLPDGAIDAWKFQLGHFLQIAWQLHPWGAGEETLAHCAKAGSPAGALLAATKAAADAIPDKDRRCYPLNPGIFWSGHFALTSHLLDARRACRDFAAWETKFQARDKDALSGKEEALIDRNWLAGVRKSPRLRHLFRNDDRLGAVNLVKRVWHVAHLSKLGFDTADISFESVYAVAAGSWKAGVIQRMREDQDTWLAFLDFAQAARDASGFQDVMEEVPAAPSKSVRGDETRWLQRLDATLLTKDGWSANIDPTQSESPAVATVRRNLDRFLQVAKTKEPTAYYAVIALDGDRVGEWLSGSHNPKIRDLVSEKAKAYFDKFPEGKAWLDTHRPLSPSFHLGFSEALSNFGLYAAGRVIEAHHGQLIYSGGDDVLAMVPAEEAIACAEGLRAAFRGAVELAGLYPDHFVQPPAEGLIVLKDAGANGVPNWPLLVPAGMTVSAGIAIGHAKAPLQDMVDEARQAESRAKRGREQGGFGRNAVAVSLLKRSGEIIHWGACFSGHGLALLACFRKLFRDDVLPSVFGHRLPALVDRFDVNGVGRVTPDLVTVISAEARWAWNQLEGGDKRRRADAEKRFFELVDDYLNELAAISVDGGGVGAPLSEFSNLFAVETFLKRHSV